MSITIRFIPFQNQNNTIAKFLNSEHSDRFNKWTREVLRNHEVRCVRDEEYNKHDVTDPDFTIDSYQEMYDGLEKYIRKFDHMATKIKPIGFEYVGETLYLRCVEIIDQTTDELPMLDIENVTVRCNNPDALTHFLENSEQYDEDDYDLIVTNFIPLVVIFNTTGEITAAQESENESTH